MGTALPLKVMPFETRPTRAHPVSTRPLHVPLPGTTTPSVLFPEESKPGRSAATARTLGSEPFRWRRLPASRIAPGRRLCAPVRLRRACRPSRVARSRPGWRELSRLVCVVRLPSGRLVRSRVGCVVCWQLRRPVSLRLGCVRRRVWVVSPRLPRRYGRHARLSRPELCLKNRSRLLVREKPSRLGRLCASHGGREWHVDPLPIWATNRVPSEDRRTCWPPVHLK
jgi:hypothetical protein